MAIDPKLLVIKPVDQLQNEPNPLNAKVLMYNGGNELKTTPLDSIKAEIVTGIKGEAIPSTVPTAWAPGNPDLYEKYDIKTAGTYTNFKDASNASLVVSSSDLEANLIQFWVKNGVSQKVLSIKPKSLLIIPKFEELSFPAAAGSVASYQNNDWKIKDGQMSTNTDFPGFSSLIWELINKPVEKVQDGNLNSISSNAVNLVIKDNIVFGDNLIDVNGQFRSGSYLSSGIFTASNNFISLQPIIVDGDIIREGVTYTLNGSGRIATANPRILFVNASNVVIGSVMGGGTAGSSPTYATFTAPIGTVKILINVNQGTNTGLDPQNSPYKDTLMINSGSVVGLPYSKYGYKLNLKTNQAYISPTGSDSNRGTKSNPLKTIEGAKKILHPNGELIFLGGDYIDFVFDPSAFRVMKGMPGEKVRFIYGDVISSASLVAGYTKVYSVPYTYSIGTWQSVFSLWQHDISDINSEILINKRHVVHKGLRYRLPSTRLRSVASIAAVEASAVPCYYFDGSTMYFQKVSGSDLSVNPIIIPKNTSVLGSDIKTVNHSNFTFLYNSLRTTQLSGILSNIEVLFANNLDGCIYTGNSISITFENCRAGGGSNDGFNGAVTGVTGTFNNYNKINLVNCWSHDNIDDAESHHAYCEVFVSGGLFEYSGSGCTPAIGCHSVYENVTVQNCTLTGFQAQGAESDSGVGTNIHCYGCVSESNGKNFEGRGLDSRFVNCNSITPTTSHFSGTYRRINCVEL